MTLPKIDYPLNEIELPSLKRKVYYRPMLVKEEKILLMAKQSESENDVFSAVKQIVNNCVVDHKFDIDKIPLYELEFFFITLRIRSIGEKVTLTFHDIEDDRDYTFDVLLDSIKIKEPEVKVSNKVQITDDIGVVMRYPPASLYDDPYFIHGTDLEEVAQEMLLSSIDKIWEGSSVHDVDADGITREELLEFISSVDLTTYKKMQEFLGTVPHMEHVIKYTNSKGTERSIVLKTLNDFFIL